MFDLYMNIHGEWFLLFLLPSSSVSLTIRDWTRHSVNLGVDYWKRTWSAERKKNQHVCLFHYTLLLFSGRVCLLWWSVIQQELEMLGGGGRVFGGGMARTCSPVACPTSCGFQTPDKQPFYQSTGKALVIQCVVVTSSSGWGCPHENHYTSRKSSYTHKHTHTHTHTRTEAHRW